MEFFGFDGEKIPEKFASYGREYSCLNETFCALAGFEQQEPIYMLVKCWDYGCETELYCGEKILNFGYMCGGKEELAKKLCRKIVSERSENCGLKEISKKIEEFYHDFNRRFFMPANSREK